MDAEFEGVHLQRMPRNFGRTRARNIGLKTARSEMMLLLDPGVEVAPETIVQMGAALEANAQVMAAVPRLLDAQGRALPVGGPLPSRAELSASCKENREIALSRAEGPVQIGSGAALMVRSSFLRGMNFLDERRFGDYGAELEIFWQIHNAGKQVAVVDAPATVYPHKLSVTLPRSAQALLAADRIAGTAAYLMKHEGFGAMVGFRLAQLGHALALLVSEPGYGLRLLMGISSAERINGSQGGVLG
jgi:GT2 family glycosyltransferase